MSDARYHQSLLELKKFGGSLDPISMRECLYGLTNNIPMLYKEPFYIGEGGTSAVVGAYCDTFDKVVAIKFALPLKKPKNAKKAKGKGLPIVTGKHRNIVC